MFREAYAPPELYPTRGIVRLHRTGTRPDMPCEGLYSAREFEYSVGALVFHGTRFAGGLTARGSLQSEFIPSVAWIGVRPKAASNQ